MSMDSCTKSDRRRADTQLARIVDIGLSYKEVLGYPGAKAYLREHGVPAPVIERVLAQNSRCRSGYDEAP